MSAVLELQGVSIAYAGASATAAAVRDVSLRISAGETYGLVGESGSGKSTIAYAALSALPEGAKVVAGRLTLAPRQPGGAVAAMVHQDPVATLNPVMTLGAQLREAVHAWRRPGRAATRSELLRVLERVGLPDPPAILSRYPHQISGGQAQRVVIAMALLAQPRLLVLDEPTTGLDATVERRVVDLIAELGRERDMAMLYISHNLGLIARVADRIGVLYAGDLVEEGPARTVLRAPRHPYTRALLDCLPRIDVKGRRRLAAIEGQIPTPDSRPPGCVFTPRCLFARPGLCDRNGVPAMVPLEAGQSARCRRLDAVAAAPPGPAAQCEAMPDPARPLLQVAALGKRYESGGLARVFGRGGGVQALVDVDLAVPTGRVVALVGESGSGKSTLARIVVGLDTASSGAGTLDAADVVHTPAARRERDLIRAVSIVFQNPDQTLNPAHSIGTSLRRALRAMGLRDRRALRARVEELLEMVRLPPAMRDARPEALSGGQRQRVAIARALAGTPRLIVADEPVSALDVSVQAAVVNLFHDIRRGRDAAILFISHDLALVRQMANHVVVLLHGQVMEEGSSDALFADPLHPYTRSLIASHHPPDPDYRPAPLPPDRREPLPRDGCPFNPACPLRIRGTCDATPPPVRSPDGARRFRCHLTPADLREVGHTTGATR
jgi:peptide/nickel transport system ATP-binding protein